MVYDPNAKSGVVAVAQLDAKAAVVDENTIDGAANGNNSKDFNGTVIEDKVNREESSTTFNREVGNTKINGEQATKASEDLVNGDPKKDVKYDVNNEHLNGDIKANVEQDLKGDVNKPASTMDIIKEEMKRPAVII